MLRRRFLAGSLAAAATPFTKPLGLSLYTIRGPLASKPAETYKAVAALGITQLEVRADNLNNHEAMIRDAGLKPVHLFIDSAVITGAWDEWAKLMARMKAAPPAVKPTLDDVIATAVKHGLKRVGISMLLPGEREGALDKINKAVETCAKAKIEFYYHNHAWEFEGEPGERFIDKLHKQLDKRAKLELDCFWAAIGGDDPAAVLKRWRGRTGSLHLKDVAANAPKKGSEFSMPPTAFKEVGFGTLDWKKILAAAKADYYFIEQDSTPGDPIESLRKSVAYLRGM